MELFEIEQLKGYTITPNFHQRDRNITLYQPHRQSASPLCDGEAARSQH